jgi:hypothetical protein
MGRDHIGIRGCWLGRDDPRLGLAGRLRRLHFLDRLAVLVGRRVAVVPLVILHQAMDLRRES